MLKILDTAGCPVLGRGPCHLYLAAHPLLRPYVAHYTVCAPQMVTAEQSGFLDLVPDASGCMVFQFNGSRLISWLWGPTTKMARVENDLGLCPLRLFIEFYPGGMSALTGWEQRELADRRLPLREVCPALERAVFEAMERSASLCELIGRVDEILLGLCLPGLPAALREAAFALRRSGGTLRIKELSALGHYSERHLNRLFSRHIGMGAKEFSRLIRVNLLLKRLHEPLGKSLTELSQEFGFFDQAHFINDFKSVCGISPGEYCKKQSVFYNENFKF